MKSQRIIFLLFLISLIAWAARGDRLYYQFSLLWGILFFGSWIWSRMSMRGIRLERSARTLRAQVGQVFEERFEVQNSSKLPRLWLEVHDESMLPGSEGSRVLTLVQARQGRSYLARTLLMQRGSFPLGPTLVSSGDIFGLFPVSVRVPFKESLLVYPMMVEVSSFPNPLGLLPGGEALRRKTHQITPNAAGVREYVHGDPLSRIHWLSTARRNHLMVKDFELDPLADVWIFLDAALDVQASKPQQAPIFRIQDVWHREVKFELPFSTEEYGVSAAASLARSYLRHGRAVGLVTAGQFLTLLPPDRGGRQLGKILEALALLQAKGAMPLRGLMETQVKHITRGSTVVVISTSKQRDLILITDHLLRRGVRPVVVLMDASTFAEADDHTVEKLSTDVAALGAPLRLISCGDNLETALAG